MLKRRLLINFLYKKNNLINILLLNFCWKFTIKNKKNKKINNKKNN
jgi:hypothetical protein